MTRIATPSLMPPIVPASRPISAADQRPDERDQRSPPPARCGRRRRRGRTRPVRADLSQWGGRARAPCSELSRFCVSGFWLQKIGVKTANRTIATSTITGRRAACGHDHRDHAAGASDRRRPARPDPGALRGAGGELPLAHPQPVGSHRLNPTPTVRSGSPCVRYITRSHAVSGNGRDRRSTETRSRRWRIGQRERALGDERPVDAHLRRRRRGRHGQPQPARRPRRSHQGGRRAARAGASIVHIHARTTDGEMTQAPGGLSGDQARDPRAGRRRRPELHDRRQARRAGRGAPPLAARPARTRVAELRQHQLRP